MQGFNYNGQQFKALEGVAYWAQEIAYVLECFGENDADLPRLRDSLRASFTECDRLAVPGWVQNRAAEFGHDWRLYASTYIDLYLYWYNIRKAAA